MILYSLKVTQLVIRIFRKKLNIHPRLIESQQMSYANKIGYNIQDCIKIAFGSGRILNSYGSNQIFDCTMKKILAVLTLYQWKIRNTYFLGCLLYSRVIFSVTVFRKSQFLFFLLTISFQYLNGSSTLLKYIQLNNITI